MRSLAELALAALPINQQVAAVERLNLSPELASQVNRRLRWIRLTRGVLNLAARRRMAAARAASEARAREFMRYQNYLARRASDARNRRRDFFRGRGRGRN